MTASINGTTGVTFPDASVQGTAATGFGFKNRIINGACMIDQRNAGASVTPTNGQYTLDRWSSYAYGSATGKFTVQQNAGSVTLPAGFTNYLGATSTSSYSVASGDITAVLQVIEGYNIADLGFGTANAATVTLSFWVRSSLTGTFGGSLRNGAATRSYPFNYSITAANTWERKTLTVAGDTTGTWNTTNSQGLFVMFGLGVGSTFSSTAGSWASGDYYSATGATSVVGTNGATFYITGVQLEKGSTATSFDYRPYGTELALCQRYYYQTVTDSLPNYHALQYNGGLYIGNATYPVRMRAIPTVTANSGSTATPGNFGVDGFYFYISSSSGGYMVGYKATAEL